MLLEFVFSNRKSIKDSVVFSTVASSDDTNEEYICHVDNYRVLKSAVIYGANGSGKSNVINALGFLQMLVLKSINNMQGTGLEQSPHKLNGPAVDSSFQIQFLKDNTRYVYGLVLNKYLVSEEYLYYFPNNRKTKIFERKDNDILPGTKFKSKFNTCKDVLRPNRLLLSCAASFSSVDVVDTAYRFFKEDIVFYRPISRIDNSWMKYSLRELSENKALKKSVLELMRGLDIDIKDIQVKIEKGANPIDELEMDSFLSEEFKEEIRKHEYKRFDAKVIYDKFATDLFKEESTGIKKLITMLGPLIDVMNKGSILVCDELETGLHEALVHGILEFFSKSPLNNNAQLIFTTHDTSLLDLDIFRRDQIWFTELSKEDRSTELYSLAEIKNVRKDKKYGRGYISGQYGAIPMLNKDFAEVISKMK